ncbi:cold shock domain-containing protein [Acinetobacter vivianii]|uniref:cold shock domain-containing protein n=1 Tax=Acinetobacter vivianii TaxID=1776742 RepID=UPI002DB58CFA|nr:cold shock domain-containing protein [Acinetobacter vivianii]MEB6480785.1 cold shock domain-containing protein [Acinetobacter vivianii]MEB6659069.1 cold shock domain-containing protein [Acinetobacter vivianii]
MFLEGKIKKYNSERGFGFIQVEGRTSDIFFHITDFPKMTGEPKLGERLKFLIVEEHGKFKATNIVRLDLKRESPISEITPNEKLTVPTLSNRTQETSKKGVTFTIVGLIVIAILSGLVFQKYQSYQQSKKLKAAQLIEEQRKIVEQQRKAIGELPEVKLSEKTKRALESSHVQSVQNKSSTKANHQFQCDGREHCSQMSSYEEALFFLKNCPNTKMDGDGDGIPCERQFGR